VCVRRISRLENWEAKELIVRRYIVSGITGVAWVI
jgi:hypothetical protein